jgi:hypothetical protein
MASMSRNPVGLYGPPTEQTTDSDEYILSHNAGETAILYSQLDAVGLFLRCRWWLSWELVKKFLF